MFDLVLENLPQLANGFALTFMITLFGIFAGLALGIFLAIGEMYGGKVWLESEVGKGSTFFITMLKESI